MTIALRSGLSVQKHSLWKILESAGLEPKLTFGRVSSSFGALHSYGCQVQIHNESNVMGAGISSILEEAYIAALGESVERACLGAFSTTIKRCSVNELEGRILSASEWLFFSDSQIEADQFPFQNYFPEDVTYWCRAKSLTGNVESIWMPASLFWLLKFPDQFMPIVSTGSAVHPDKSQALVSGLLEVIERDALALNWESHRIPPRISVSCSTLDHLLPKGNEHFFEDLEICFVNLLTDLKVPVVGCVIFDENSPQSPAASFGSAAAFTQQKAIEKAFIEAVHTWQWMAEQAPMASKLGAKAAAEAVRFPAEMMKHAVYYTFASHAKVLRRFTSGLLDNDSANEDLVCYSVKEQLDKLKDILSTHMLEAYCVELNSELFRDTGLYGYKVVVPGLVPIGVGTLAKPYGHPRLQKLLSGGVDQATYNPHPHPLP